jgi:hypothetical protein
MDNVEVSIIRQARRANMHMIYCKEHFPKWKREQTHTQSVGT